MLKKYRNRLLEVIQEKGINPALFHIKDEVKDDAYSRFSLQLLDTKLAFTVRNPPHSFHSFDWFYTEFTPNFSRTAVYPPSGFASEEKLIIAFGDWLENHVKAYTQELLEPDMWERIESQIPLVTGSEISEEDTTVFSDDEKIRVRMSINEFRILLIKNFEPSSDELKVIDDRLEYLSNSVDRLNKIDWRSVAITTLISISLALSLDTEKGRLLFDLFMQVFSGVLHLIQ